MLIIIDSNIWAYYFDGDAPEHPLVVDEVEKLLKSEKIAINTVIIMEVAHFLVKNLGPVLGKEKVDIFLQSPFTIVDLDHNLMLKSIEYLTKYSHQGIGGRDATILATANTLRSKRIMTHDEAFKRIDKIEVIDPISK
ncbi:MAG TPA: type II toxin-antitoxin system VapC family toxin [Nitrososphaerales archaeon]